MHRDSRDRVINSSHGYSKHGRTCCCHTITGAAIVGLLQLLIVCLTLSTSGMMLDRWRLWESYELTDVERVSTTSAASVVATSFLPNITTDFPDLQQYHWTEALAELMLAFHVTFCVCWIVSILLYALAFRYYRSFFVVPNLTLLVISAVFTLMVIATMMIFLFDSDKEYQKDEYEESMMIYAVTFLWLWWLIDLGFIYVVHKFYKWIKSEDLVHDEVIVR